MASRNTIPFGRGKIAWFPPSKRRRLFIKPRWRIWLKRAPCNVESQRHTAGCPPAVSYHTVEPGRWHDSYLTLGHTVALFLKVLRTLKLGKCTFLAALIRTACPMRILSFERVHEVIFRIWPGYTGFTCLHWVLWIVLRFAKHNQQMDVH